MCSTAFSQHMQRCQLMPNGGRFILCNATSTRVRMWALPYPGHAADTLAQSLHILGLVQSEDYSSWTLQYWETISVNCCFQHYNKAISNILSSALPAWEWTLKTTVSRTTLWKRKWVFISTQMGCLLISYQVFTRQVGSVCIHASNMYSFTAL